MYKGGPWVLLANCTSSSLPSPPMLIKWYVCANHFAVVAQICATYV